MTDRQSHYDIASNREVEAMRTASREVRRPATRPMLRLVPSPQIPAEPEVVAEVLADGSVRPRNPRVRSDSVTERHGWSSGSLADEDWTLWWERRSS